MKANKIATNVNKTWQQYRNGMTMYTDWLNDILDEDSYLFKDIFKKMMGEAFGIINSFLFKGLLG